MTLAKGQYMTSVPIFQQYLISRHWDARQKELFLVPKTRKVCRNGSSNIAAEQQQRRCVVLGTRWIFFSFRMSAS